MTLAELRRRVPNMPEAELRKNLQQIRRLEEFGREIKRKMRTPEKMRSDPDSYYVSVYMQNQV